MDYKKKFEDFLDKMQGLLDSAKKQGHIIVRVEDIENTFPELKESEDERIRKAILNYFTKCWGNCKDDVCGIHVEDVIAWLERQCEQKQAHKYEPMFKVGDWVVTDKNGVVQIKAIKNDNYVLENASKFSVYYVDKCWKKWDISDAKEGDVLSNGKMIVLFKHFEEPSYKQHIVAYIGLDAIGAIQITDDAWYLGIGKTYPATKEQRELLFQKMKKAGYEWDAENKELKKIEPKFKAGNWYQCTKDFFGKGVTFDKNTAYYCAKEGCLQCEYGCHIAIVKDLYDNFKLWTISDAKDGDVLYSLDSNQPFIYKARNGYEQATAYCGLNIYGKFFVWDTKDCVITLNNYVPATKEQRDALLKAMADAGYEWDVKKKELKKIKQKQAIDCIDSHPKDNWELVHEFVEKFGRMPEDEDELNVLVEYVLKRQKPTEWNEEDDYNLQCMIAKAVKDIQNGNVGRNQELINWLKSIKDRVQHQKQWKPSEEQLEFLKKCIESYNEVSFPTEFRLFRTLYNDLKKLTE